MIDLVVTAVKRLWHHDLVVDPEVHAWVLSLYRAGELYPDTVDDYFPVALAPWPWLAEAIARHRDDERRHGAMLARAIKRSGHAVTDFAGADVFNHMIRTCTVAAWRALPHDGPDARRRKLAHFLAHAHHLERRIARSMELHHEACERANVVAPELVVRVILHDELRHVAYTRDAARELVGAAEAIDILEHHRRAEARANLLFSQRQVERFVERFGPRAPRRHRVLFRAGALCQRVTAALV